MRAILPQRTRTHKGAESPGPDRKATAGADTTLACDANGRERPTQGCADTHDGACNEACDP